MSKSRESPPAQKASDDELMSAIARIDDPVATTTEIAEQVELGADAVRLRLKKLEEDGHIASKGHRTVWWLTSNRDTTSSTTKHEELERRVSIIEEQINGIESENKSDSMLGFLR